MVPPADAATAELAERLAACCRQRRPGAEQVRVSDLQRVFGGGSRETWRFTLTETRAGRDEVHALVLRRDPATSLIDTQRRVEVAALRAFEGSAVPVPRTWWLEEDPQPLGHPYFVMEAITGCEAGPMKLMAPPYMAHHAAIARQAWTLLGHIARTDPATDLSSGKAGCRRRCNAAPWRNLGALRSSDQETLMEKKWHLAHWKVTE